ncbi:MAG: hypothetical protein LBT00_00460 [Spirochaetaceae bacterium]|jgi:hypothetical protein|nr:hypothetical protein [Spirochaetaceae bacterium]
MTFEQTVEIPETQRVTIDIPREFPTGAATITFTPKAAFSADETRHRETVRDAIEQCRGIAKGVLSSDEIIAMRRKDKALEEAQKNLKDAIETACNLAKNSRFSSEALFEERRKDRALDEAQFRRLFEKGGEAD